MTGKLDSVNHFENLLSGSLVRRTFKPLIVWWQHFKEKIKGPADFTKLCKAIQWTNLDLTYRVEKFTLSMWDNFFSKKITPEGKNEDDFTDFWDPSSYNPLDSVEDLNSEQLKAWDFLQSRNTNTSVVI